MKFMLLMQGSKAMWDEYFSWGPDDLHAHAMHMRRMVQDLQRTGELVLTEGLAHPRAARLVTAGKGGVPEVTDGPFAEAKEWLAGWCIVDVDDAQRAHEIAARLSAAPGPGGAPGNQPIEVREVMSGPPAEA